MINITLYQFNKKVNSTAIPGAGVSSTDLTCLVRSPSSIISPVIELRTNPLQYNYAYIPSFSRYYFINDIVYNEGLWIVSLTVDVMASFKAEISTQSMYVLRSASRYDGNIPDHEYPLMAGYTDAIITGTPGEEDFTGFASGYYVIGVQGQNNASSNGVIYYSLDAAQFVTMLNGFYANSGSLAFWGNLAKGVIDSLNQISEFIVSCRWYPAELTTGASQKMYIGSYDTGLTVPIVTDGLHYTDSFTLQKHPQAAARGDYMNAGPFTRYVMVDRKTGFIELDSSLMANATTLKRYTDIDHTTGQALISYSLDNNTASIYQTYCQFGVDIDLAGSSTNVMGALGSLAGATVDFFLGDYIGASAGIGNMAANFLPTHSGQTSAGGYVSLRENAYLHEIFMPAVDDDLTNRGRPLCKYVQLITLSGYVIVDRPHVEISGTAEEAAQINTYLASGAYYE